MKPLVSIVMAVYNGQKYLQETIDSILKQNYENIELIIVDDCSTDGSWKILESNLDDRIVLLKNEKNMRLAYSLNKAIAIAKGKYIARMDADDICLPDRLGLQVAYLEEHSDIDVLGGNYRSFGATNKKSDYQELHNWIKTGLIFENTVCHPAVMFRRDAIEGWYDQNFVASQDYDLWTRLIRSHKFHNLKQELIMYRVHNGQTVKKLSGYQKAGADKARLRMLEKSSFSENEKEELIRFSNYPKIESIIQFKYYCKLIEAGKKKCEGIDLHAYRFYSSKCIWNNVLHLKNNPLYVPIALYAVMHYGDFLLKRPRMVYYILKGMIGK